MKHEESRGPEPVRCTVTGRCDHDRVRGGHCLRANCPNSIALCPVHGDGHG